MKINVNEHGTIVLEEVFNPIKLKSADDETLIISMRDSGFEVIYENNFYELKEGQLFSRGQIHPESDEREFSVHEETKTQKDWDMLLEEVNKDILDVQYSNMVKETLDKLIMYCRQMQKSFMEEDGSISGVHVLAEMLQNGSIPISMYMNILPAVERYNKPYELKQT